VQSARAQNAEDLVAPQATDEPADQLLIEEATRHIRKVVGETVHQGALSVGTYILDRFFCGDIERVVLRSPTKHASFRLLAKRCGTPELPISKSWLHSAVGLAIMHRALPEDAAFRKLPPTHQVALLPLRQPQVIEGLARQALAERLSSRELRHIARERHDRLTGGSPVRHGASAIVEAMRSVNRLLSRASHHFTLAHIDKLSKEEVTSALRVAQEALTKLAEFSEKLELRSPGDISPG
jgi:hypothetical protein